MSASGSVAHRTSGLVRRNGGWTLESVRSTTSPDIVLTVDDGPDPAQTPRVLASLAEHGATATFFVLMTRVARHPEILDAIVAGGHEVALHGVDHRPLTQFSEREVAEQLRDARTALEDRIGAQVRWLRPAFGRQNPATWRAARRAGLTPILWSGSIAAVHAESAETRLQEAIDTGEPGAIVLAYDGVPGPEDGTREARPLLDDNAAQLDAVLRAWTHAGRRVRALRDVLAAGARTVKTVELTQFGQGSTHPTS